MMKRTLFPLWLALSAWLGGGWNLPGADVPTMLDLSPFFWERFVTPERTNMEMVSVAGRREFDGIPFQVDGRACLYGRLLAGQRNRPASAYPDITGVPVGRPFAELHLLHATQFTDREGETVATVRLNYADGTRHDFPMVYGGHVRDWQRLQSEEKETYTDPGTKVVWRGPGVARFKSTTRMSKTVLANPFPRKTVATVDFLSAGKAASYDVAAATVANRDSARPVTPPVPPDRPERRFDGRMQVLVTDEAGRPIEGVLVTPNIAVAGSLCATVATPFYTSADGSGTVRYPKNESACLYFTARKDGWRRVQEDPWVRLHRFGGTNAVLETTIRMAREFPEAAAAGTVAVAVPPGTGAVPGVPSVVFGAGHFPDGIHILPPERRPVLPIDFPAGSDVRIEYTDDLASAEWRPLTVITNLPSSPYAHVCGNEPSAGPQRFYRAVLLP